MKQVFDRVRTLVVSGENGRFIGIHLESLLVPDLLFGAVKPDMVVRLWLPPSHAFRARNWQAPSSGSAWIAFTVPNSVSRSTPLICWLIRVTSFLVVVFMVSPL